MGGAAGVFWIFLRLGLTSFGGPIAHLGYFRDAFVTRRRWLDDAAYADLVALCQFLPGPTSSQVGFALGLQRAGPLGGAAAWAGFTLPSAVLMIAAASSLVLFATPAGQAIAHGLKLVAVAVVAQAVFGMARSLCTTWLRVLIAVAALMVLLLSGSPWLAPALIALGGVLGLAFAQVAPAQAAETPRTPWRRSALLLAVFAILLLALPLAAQVLGDPLLARADSFYRAGALVFGGGHVVLPLLEAETVEQGWIDESRFLAGYGAAQALPGPLFAFAAFLGAAGPGEAPWLASAIVALTFVFLPGLLLAAACVPLWRRLKRYRRALGFVAGANAAVVGVLAAALYDPIFTSSVRGPADLALAAAGFAALQWLKAPSWAVVVGLGAAGAALSFWGLIG
jgi:chromate transporter